MTNQSQTRLPDWLTMPDMVGGMERIEAFFGGAAYGTHRHDTYAFGCTISGVQAFNYRGQTRRSLPGDVMVLHPDEPHDGQAETDEGFHYRMVYVDPYFIQQALGGRSLPFVQGGIANDPRLRRATSAVLSLHPGDLLADFDALAELAFALADAHGASNKEGPVDLSGLKRARDFLLASTDQPVSMDDLATVTGRDRWSISRDFRRFFGTSPSRFLRLRRLQCARDQMRLGRRLADVAASCGFSDQAHMTRQFTQTYGISPARWLQFVKATPRTNVQDGIQPRT